MLSSLKLFVKEAIGLSTKNPDKPPIPLYQRLILKLYHFHLALFPPKPIRTSLVEEPYIAPPLNSPLNSSNEDAIKPCPKIKSTLPAKHATPNPNPKPPTKQPKYDKTHKALSQKFVVAGLCELKHTHPKKLGKRPNKIVTEARKKVRKPL